MASDALAGLLGILLFTSVVLNIFFAITASWYAGRNDALEEEREMRDER